MTWGHLFWALLGTFAILYFAWVVREMRKARYQALGEEDWYSEPEDDGAANRLQLSRLKTALKNVFRRPEHVQAEEYADKATRLVQVGDDEGALPYAEQAAELDPRYKYMLAVIYCCAGDDRLGKDPLHEGPLSDLRDFHFGIGKKLARMKAEEILRLVRKARLLDKKGSVVAYISAYGELDTALNHALEMYDKAIETVPHGHTPHFARARAFKTIADSLLMVFAVFPADVHTPGDQGTPVTYRKATFGVYVGAGTPDMPFPLEILWLYGKSVEDFQEALALDPKHVESHIQLSHILGQLGKKKEAAAHAEQALAIVNKAIQSDPAAAESYRTRARILEQSGQTEAAIADLEQALAILRSTPKSSRASLMVTEERLRRLRNAEPKVKPRTT